MKKLLLFVFAAIAANFGFSQTGTISIVSIPNEIEAGTEGTLEFTYTSDVEVDFTVTLFLTEAGEYTSDYSQWKASVTEEGLPAGEDLTATIMFAIPAGLTPTMDLFDVDYTFDLKLTSSENGDDFGWNNGTAVHSFEVILPSTPVDNIYFLNTPPASATTGEEIPVRFRYTLPEERHVKVGIAIYDEDDDYVENAMVGDDEVASYFSNAPMTAANGIAKDTVVAILTGLTPSADIAPNKYKLVITIADTDWGYIMDQKSDITILAGTATSVDDALNTEVNVSPNPVIDFVKIEYKGAIEDITIASTSGATINIDVDYNNSVATLSTTDLENGVYVITVITDKGTITKTIVK